MNVEALKELAAKVEAGTIQDEPYGGMPMFSQFHDNGFKDNAINGFSDGKAMGAYNGYLDAAKALHDAIVSDWTVAEIRQYKNGWVVKLTLWDDENRKRHYSIAKNACVARAWMLADFRALIAQEEGN